MYKGLKEVDWNVLKSENINSIDHMDIIILKLYLGMLGLPIKDTEDEFMFQLKEYLRKYDNDKLILAMNPRNFNFTDVNIKRIKEFIKKINQTMKLSNNISTDRIFDLLAVICLEALQYVQSVPVIVEVELESIDTEIKRYSRIRKGLSKFFTMIK